MDKYKIDVFDNEFGEEYTKVVDSEEELYKEIGGIMWLSQEILGIWHFDIKYNQVEAGTIHLDEKETRFYISWELLWQA